MNNCKKCGAEISEGAKLCSVCGEKIETVESAPVSAPAPKTPKGGGNTKQPIYYKWWFWLIIVLALLIIIPSGDGDSTGGSSAGEQEEQKEQSKQETPSSKYSVYSVSKLIDDLETNALTAKEKYKGTYVEITGRVDVIDASGKYISLYPADDEWAFTSVQCYIKNSEQKEFVKNISKGDVVTLRGKITDVGEILGYTLNITEFVD